MSVVSPSFVEALEAAGRLEDFQHVIRDPNPRRLALLLYGSVARGTATLESDVDLLELVAREPASYHRGSVNVTQYVPAHLQALASQGSLFVLHLRVDGLVLADQYGALKHALSAYQAPSSYEPLWNQLAIAAGALDPVSSDLEEHVSGLSRLGMYVLRTATYLAAIESGQLTFDLDEAALALRLDTLGEAFTIRRRTDVSSRDVAVLRDAIGKLIPDVPGNNTGSVVAYCVANSTRADLASLFGAVLEGTASIDYSALTLPPL